MAVRTFSRALLAPAALLLSAPWALAEPVEWSYAGQVRTNGQAALARAAGS